jgi:hypothetical protein
MPQVKRFRVFDIENQSCPARFDTTIECYNWLKDKDNLDDYFIDCVVDDITVMADDFCNAFNEGERPTDLQFF